MAAFLDAQATLQRAVTESTETDLTMLARSMDVELGTVQLSPLHGRSPLLLQEEDVLVVVASFIDALRDSS